MNGIRINNISTTRMFTVHGTCPCTCTVPHLPDKTSAPARDVRPLYGGLAPYSLLNWLRSQ
eukprot:3185885-Pyramimonas_sp.AAC.1